MTPADRPCASVCADLCNVDKVVYLYLPCSRVQMQRRPVSETRLSTAFGAEDEGGVYSGVYRGEAESVLLKKTSWSSLCEELCVSYSGVLQGDL